MKLKIGIVFTLIALALVIAAYSVSWYHIEATYPNISTIKPNEDFYFFWQKYTYKSNGQSTDYQYKNNDLFDKDYPNVEQTFNSVLGILVPAGAVLIASAVWNILRLVMKCARGSFARIIGILLAVAAVVLLSVSFFSFLNITKAFFEDEWSYCRTGLTASYDARNCEKFLGNDAESTLGIQSTYNYSPDAGWWLILGAIVAAGLGLGHVFQSERD